MAADVEEEGAFDVLLDDEGEEPRILFCSLLKTLPNYPLVKTPRIRTLTRCSMRLLISASALASRMTNPPYNSEQLATIHFLPPTLCREEDDFALSLLQARRQWAG